MTRTFEIDVVTPVPVLTLALDTGSNTSDGVTRDGTVIVSNLEEGATWEYSTDNGATWSTPQSWTPGDVVSFSVPAGTYAAGVVQVRQTDIAGNTATDSLLGALTVDTTAPDAPTVTILDDANNDGVLNANELAGNTSGEITVQVGLPAGSVDGDKLAYSINNGPLNYYTVTAADVLAGTVDLQVPVAVEGAIQTIRVQSIDRAGNVSSATSESVLIDTLGPQAPSISVSIDDGDGYVNAAESSAVVISGVLAADATLEGLVVSDAWGNLVTVPIGSISVDPMTYAFSTSADLTSLTDGPLTVTMQVADPYGNVSTRTDTSTLLTQVSVAITAISDDTGTAGDFSTTDTTLSIHGTTNAGTGGTLSVTFNGVTYTLGSSPELTLTGNDWTLDLQGQTLGAGSYTLVANVTDIAGNTQSANQSIVITAIAAVDDQAAIDLGSAAVVVHDTVEASGVVVLGLAQASTDVDASTSFVVQPDHQGSVAITISQNALLSVANAFAVDVYSASGERVFTATTPDSLVGNVGGVTLVGLSGSDELTAVIHGLEPGSYYVVVRNDQSMLESILDPDGGGLSLAELGSTGMVIGPNNKAVLLNAIETSLNGSLGSLPLPPVGTAVRVLLDAALTGVDSIGVGYIVGLINSSTLGATSFADVILDAVAEVLFSNLLTAFQFTDINLTLTEYEYSGTLEVTGNVISGDVGGSGEDEAPLGSLITEVENSAGTKVQVAATGQTVVVGEHGVLTIEADGSYHYETFGNPASFGQSETFTYTLSVPGSASDQAVLTIDITGPTQVPAAADDSAEMDMGDLISTVQAPIAASNLQFLGLLEGVGGTATGVPFTVAVDHRGDAIIQVRQTALVAIADAVRIDVIDSTGKVVYSGVSASNPLLGSVAGLEVLGLTGDNTIVAKVHGLAEGDYQIVVRKDEGAAATLLGGLDLTQLGAKGVVLGPENEELILDAVDMALDGNALSGTVRAALQLSLDAAGAVGVGDLVGTVTAVLNSLGLTSLVDEVLSTIASSLVTNILTVLQTTEVLATITDYQFQGTLAVSGNVVSAGAGNPGDVDDQMPQGSIVTQVTNSKGEAVTVIGSGASGVSIEGEYGVLTLYEDGTYHYDAFGARNALGQNEVFTYTVTNGDFNTDGTRVTSTANLTIAIDGVGVASDTISADVVFAPREAAFTMPAAITDSWLAIATRTTNSSSFTVAADTLVDVNVTLNSTNLISLFGDTVVRLQEQQGTQWVTVKELRSDVLIGLLGGGSGTFSISDLEAGTYRFSVFASGIAPLGSYTLSYTGTQTFVKDLVVDQAPLAEGSLLENDVIRGDGAGGLLPYALQVWDDTSSSYVTVSATTTLEGLYGNLTVQTDGSYSYQARTDLALEDFVDPQPEVFKYQLDYGTHAEAAELSVAVVASGYEGFAVLLNDSSIALVEEGTGLYANYSVIDLTDPSTDADTLALTRADVLKLETQEDGLIIQGDSEDTLDLSAEPWTKGTSMTIDGTQYHSYTHLDTQIWVDDAIRVEAL